MLQDSYASEKQQREHQEKNCKKIDKYRVIRKKVYSWYNDFGLQYPRSSENNYRDGWFHYRKLYREHSAFEIISQEATLDEHLQRAEKDSVIYFFQRLCELLQFWYTFETEANIDAQTVDINLAISLYDETKDQPNKWTMLLSREYGQNLDAFVDACVVVAKTRILTGGFKRETQKLLHEIKNAILPFRINGMRIYRIDEPGEYYRAFENIYERFIVFCNAFRIKNLIGMTEIIQNNLNMRHESNGLVR